ncbi:MAG: EAL domain-containing protein [Gammaproteobacteria bacterium]|nr:EAL domain-containing protein [Gammaproteobacteria bacterium]NNF61371.1 EAL domain-containing protein [Gammaproteobacteria bacterium]
MTGELLQTASYAFNVHALPTAAAVAVVFGVSLATLVREARSPAAPAFAVVAVAMFTWMIGSTIMYLAATPSAADFWARFGTIGVVFTPAAALLFTNVVIDAGPRLRRLAWACCAISTVFVITAFLSPHHISSVELRWWGFYPRYGSIGILFMLYVAVVLSLCVGLLWLTFRAASKGDTQRNRVRLLMVGIAVASASSVDFLATVGVPSYPVGFSMILFLFCVIAYVTWNYRLYDITAALAGQRIIDTMTDALVVTDADGIIRLLNPAACELLGAPEEELLDTSFQPGQQLQRDSETRERLARGETLRNVETRFRHPNGEPLTLSMSASVLHEGGKTQALIYVLCDISARKEAEERIRFLAYNDSLTKLPNRLFFDERLAATLEEARHANKTVTVLYFDVDRFKRINDTLGHDAGDELLCCVANRLSVLLDDHDIVSLDHSRPLGGILARLGGDEFALALDDVTQIMEIRRVAQGLLDTFSEPFTLGDQDVFCSTSIGISQYPRDGEDVHTLLKNADTAMYHAKDAGRNNYKFYNESMSPVTLSRLDLESDLRKALERNQFELFYQPQVDIRTGRIFGAEALLRWHHPERGTVSPAEFIPLAEETGLIIPIGQWVLQEACNQARLWHDAGFTEFKMAVNLSERQFRQNTLVLVVSQALAKSGLDPAALELELTEGTIMRNAEDTVFTLTELKSMGMHISVDDFGTGYSSLSYLKRFPIDVIKIDRSFVKDITTDPDDAAITASIIAMARSLKRDVIAEGVETMEQAHALRNRGCVFMQGFMFSRPLNAAMMLNMLETNATETNEANIAQLA